MPVSTGTRRHGRAACMCSGVYARGPVTHGVSTSAGAPADFRKTWVRGKAAKILTCPKFSRTCPAGTYIGQINVPELEIYASRAFGHMDLSTPDILGPFRTLLKMVMIDLDLQGHLGSKRSKSAKNGLVRAITRDRIPWLQELS